ncbi:MAG: hypothetical protein V4747_13950 [Pseudomonadota bacterium]
MQAEPLTPNRMFDLLNEADLDAMTRTDAVGLIAALRTWIGSDDPPEVYPVLGYDVFLDGAFVVSLDARTQEGALKTAQALGALTTDAIESGRASAVERAPLTGAGGRYRLVGQPPTPSGKGAYVFDLGTSKWCYVNGGVGDVLEMSPEEHMAMLEQGDENVSDAR